MKQGLARRTGTVYGLADPRTGKIRYVGGTIQKPSRRLNAHYAETRWRIRSRLGAWLKELRSLSMRPEVVVLQSDVPIDMMAGAEATEMARLRPTGDLLNRTRSTSYPSSEQLLKNRQAWLRRVVQ